MTSATENATTELELAHVMPGRIRLRWRGEAPPAELLAEIQREGDVAALDYRPASRSLVVSHHNGFAVERLRTLARRAGVEVVEPPPPPPLMRDRPRRPPLEGKRGAIVADAEALLLVGLLVSWVRDLVVSRTVRIGTLLLILLTALNLYQHFQRRGSKADAEEDLELLPA